MFAFWKVHPKRKYRNAVTYWLTLTINSKYSAQFKYCFQWRVEEKCDCIGNKGRCSNHPSSITSRKNESKIYFMFTTQGKKLQYHSLIDKDTGAKLYEQFINEIKETVVKNAQVNESTMFHFPHKSNRCSICKTWNVWKSTRPQIRISRTVYSLLWVLSVYR